MIRIPGKAALALLHAVSAAFVVSSRDGYAQDRSGDRGPSHTALGAAVAEAQRSPFHRVGAAGSVIAPGSARVAITPPRGGVRRAMFQEAGQDAATGEASMSEVFLVTAVAAHLSDIVGLYLFFDGGFRPAGRTADLLVLSGVGVAALGPSLAAGFLGREFGAALVGSVLGALAGAAAGVAVGESGMPFGLAYSLGALVHAGAVTLAVSEW